MRLFHILLAISITLSPPLWSEPNPQTGWTQLHQAVAQHDIDRIKQLLTFGANPNLVDKDGFTPLHLAALNGASSALKLLLDHGADMNVVVHGETPLMRAISADARDCARILFEAGADLTGATTKGKTPLHIAAAQGQVWAIHEALARGANIHALDQRGFTPLLSAALFQQPEGIKALLEAGAEGPGFENVWLAHTYFLAAFPSLSQVWGMGQNSISREAFAALVMAQSLEFGGTLPLQAGRFKLNTGAKPHFSGIMLESLIEFFYAYPDQLNEQELDALISFLSFYRQFPYPTRENLVQNIQEGTVVQLPTGFSGHAIVSTIIDEYLIINNKGAYSQRPGEIYKIDKTKVSIDTIRQMTNEYRTGLDYLDWLDNLPTTFGAVSDEFSQLIEGLYPLEPLQITGNCSWESVETGIFFNLAVQRFLEPFKNGERPNDVDVQRLQDTFVHWVRFTQLRGVENYLKLVDEGEIPFNSELAYLAYHKLLEIDKWYGMDARATKIKERLSQQLGNWWFWRHLPRAA